MLLLQILISAKWLSIAIATCTGMSSPQNMNANAGNLSSPGWMQPLHRSDVCEWVLNIAGLTNNVVVMVNLRIDTVNTINCAGGGLEMPNDSTECGKRPNRCFVYSYGSTTNTCRRKVAQSMCRLILLPISQWPLRFKYTQDINGRSKGFFLDYAASDCDSIVLKSPPEETDPVTTTPVAVTATNKMFFTPSKTSNESTTAAPLEPVADSNKTMTVVLIVLAVVILLLVIAVFTLRCYKRKKAACSSAPQVPPEHPVGVYGSNGANLGIYTAAEECEGGYDDSVIRQRPTPAPRTASNVGDTAEPADGVGYDDFRLKQKPKEEFHFYQEVRKKSSGIVTVGQEATHAYEEIRRASSGMPNNRVVQPPSDEYSYDE